MNGRQLFEKVESVLGLFVLFLKLFPARLVVMLWPLVGGIPGVLGRGLRYVLAKRLAGSCGRVVNFGTGIIVKSWPNLHLGDRVNLNENIFIDAVGGVDIGSDVSIAHGSSILSFEHTWDDRDTPIKYNPLALKRVRISSDVWIGCGVRLLAGVSLGSRVVVAAGAVVRRGDYSSGVYGGVPAKLIKQL